MNNNYPACFMDGCAIAARYEFSDDLTAHSVKTVKVFACYLHQCEGAEAAHKLQRVADGKPLDASEA